MVQDRTNANKGGEHSYQCHRQWLGGRVLEGGATKAISNGKGNANTISRSMPPPTFFPTASELKDTNIDLRGGTINNQQGLEVAMEVRRGGGGREDDDNR